MRRGRVLLTVSLASLLALVVGAGIGLAIPRSSADLEAATSQSRDLKAQAEELDADLRAATEEGRDSEERLQDAEERADAATGALMRQNRRLKSLKSRLDAAHQETERLEAELATSESDLEEPEPLNEAPETPPADPETSGEGAADFDAAYAKSVAGDIVDGLKTVDHRLGDGIAVSSALYLLSGDYDRLADAGTPPSVDAATYHARLSTLADFANQASNVYDDDPMEGTAQYEVVRKETGVLFNALNSSLGTSFTLP